MNYLSCQVLGKSHITFNDTNKTNLEIVRVDQNIELVWWITLFYVNKVHILSGFYWIRKKKIRTMVTAVSATNDGRRRSAIARHCECVCQALSSRACIGSRISNISIQKNQFNFSQSVWARYDKNVHVNAKLEEKDGILFRYFDRNWLKACERYEKIEQFQSKLNSRANTKLPMLL